MKVFICQTSPYAGDLEGNFSKIRKLFWQASNERCDICVFPELMTTGYFARDLFLKKSFISSMSGCLHDFIAHTKESDIYVILPTPILEDNHLYNGLLVIHDGELIAKSYKNKLPNREIFDEKRYFTERQSSIDHKSQAGVINIKGINIGMPICEDIWSSDVCNELKTQGAELFIIPNASPFNNKKLSIRKQIIQDRFKETNIPMIYCNQVLGQDGIIFDGNSFIYDGKLRNVCKAFEEDHAIIHYNHQNKILTPNKVSEVLVDAEEIYLAMVLGVRDYIQRNGFDSVLLGLSGGIDSALVATIAVDALGADNVLAVMMPTEFTSKQSFIDARSVIDNLGIQSETIDISNLVQQFANLISVNSNDQSTTHQNLQSRIRGTILMGLSNKYKKLLLTTGNKSEYATGYATLYGDMNGAFNPIKDLYKTELYKIVEYRNNNIPRSSLINLQKKNIISENIIKKAPSAELAHNQKDSDSLPEYHILDGILKLYIEQDLGYDEIIKKGFDKQVVQKVITLVEMSEFKRRQAAPGVRLTIRNFEDDRRYPLARVNNASLG